MQTPCSLHGAFGFKLIHFPPLNPGVDGFQLDSIAIKQYHLKCPLEVIGLYRTDEKLAVFNKIKKKKSIVHSTSFSLEI